MCVHASFLFRLSPNDVVKQNSHAAICDSRSPRTFVIQILIAFALDLSTAKVRSAHLPRNRATADLDDREHPFRTGDMLNLASNAGGFCLKKAIKLTMSSAVLQPFEI